MVVINPKELKGRNICYLVHGSDIFSAPNQTDNTDGEIQLEATALYHLQQ